VLTVRLDGKEKQHQVVLDAREYPHLDHGYAATVYKAQGTTVDRTYVLASPHFDRHSTYVALSRHREGAALFYGREDFQPEWSKASPQENFRSLLSRARPKELAHDYLEPGIGVEGSGMSRGHAPDQRGYMNRIERLQQEAVRTWQAFREKQKATELQKARQKELERARAHQRDQSHDRDHDLEL
jgi:Viral (Superfamily 1) RNA helicase